MSRSDANATRIWESRRRAIVRDSLSVGIAVGAYGLSFGALSTITGLSVLQTQTLSALMFTGASQFALIGVLGAGGGAASAVVTSVLLGVRNTLYGLRVTRSLDVSGPKRLLAAQFTIDETTAMALSHETVDDPRAFRLGFWTTGLAVYLCWNCFTFIGAISISSLGDPRKLGLDAAIPAGFLALLWPRLKRRSAWALAVVSAAFALALTPALRPGLPVLAAAVVAVLAATHGIDLAPPEPSSPTTAQSSGTEVLRTEVLGNAPTGSTDVERTQ